METIISIQDPLGKILVFIIVSSIIALIIALTKMSTRKHKDVEAHKNKQGN